MYWGSVFKIEQVNTKYLDVHELNFHGRLCFVRQSLRLQQTKNYFDTLKDFIALI